MNALPPLFLGAMFTANFLLATGLGLGWLPEGPRKIETAGREALAAALTVSAAVMVSVFVDRFCLATWDAVFLRVPVFILLVFLVLKAVARYTHLPCRLTLLPAGLAATIWVERQALSWLETAVQAAGIGFGIGTALVLVAGMMERVDLSLVPKDFRPVPIFFVSLGLLSLAFSVKGMR